MSEITNVGMQAMNESLTNNGCVTSEQMMYVASRLIKDLEEKGDTDCALKVTLLLTLVARLIDQQQSLAGVARTSQSH